MSEPPEYSAGESGVEREREREREREERTTHFPVSETAARSIDYGIFVSSLLSSQNMSTSMPRPPPNKAHMHAEAHHNTPKTLVRPNPVGIGADHGD